MKRNIWLIALLVGGSMSLMAQKETSAVEAQPSVSSVVSKPDSAATPQDTATFQLPVKEIPLWKKKLYYGYNFDIYFHHDSRSNRKENGWSIALEPEVGWKLKERIYLGLRVGGSYQDTYSTFTYENDLGEKVSEDLRIQQGAWSVTPYLRYRLKTVFNGKVGIWLEAHLYTGMEFPHVKDDIVAKTDYDGLKHSVIYGFQLAPVITYQFNRKSTFQVFFSILSLGYSGTAFFYVDDPITNKCHYEYTNDVIIFSGKLRNLIANQFTPGLYGLKFGVQKSF